MFIEIVLSKPLWLTYFINSRVTGTIKHRRKHIHTHTHTQPPTCTRGPLNDCAVPFGSNSRPSSAIDLGVAEAHAGSIARHLASLFLFSLSLALFHSPSIPTRSLKLRSHQTLFLCLPNIFCHYLEGHRRSRFSSAPL